MSVAESIRQKLSEAFEPDVLEVIDQSHLHAGHVGARPEGETHFKVDIVSNRFRCMTRIEGQRAVFKVLAKEMAGPVHALSVHASAPEDNGK